MAINQFSYIRRLGDQKLAGSMVLFLCWFVFVIYLTTAHVMWRDEVRALSFAVQGKNIVEMIQLLHGEGHPALWYILLRVGWWLYPSPDVLKILSFIIASIAVFLFTFRSPFNRLIIIMFLFGYAPIFEYSVMARNYGISMLLMFMIAATYNHYNQRGFIIGFLLFLLANTNVHSALLVGAFLVFWLIDMNPVSNIYDRRRKWKIFAINSCIALLGIALCFATVFPTFNDLAINKFSLEQLPFTVISSVLFPIFAFNKLIPIQTIVNLSLLFLGKLGIINNLDTLILAKYFSIIMTILIGSATLIGSTFGLRRNPGAFIAALLALIGLSLFFSIIYPLGYRHQALWFIFLISLYWIVLEQNKNKENADLIHSKSSASIASLPGSGFLLILLIFQLLTAINSIIFSKGVPQSRSRDFASFVKSRSYLKNAIIIADPDFLLEALPYYISNRTYLLREQRFGKTVRFTRKAKTNLSLYDVLLEAKRLHKEKKVPIVILLSTRLDSLTAPINIFEGKWRFTANMRQVAEFKSKTTLLKSFPPACSDESFDAYLLR